MPGRGLRRVDSRVARRHVVAGPGTAPSPAQGRVSNWPEARRSRAATPARASSERARPIAARLKALPGSSVPCASEQLRSRRATPCPRVHVCRCHQTQPPPLFGRIELDKSEVEVLPEGIAGILGSGSRSRFVEVDDPDRKALAPDEVPGAEVVMAPRRRGNAGKPRSRRPPDVRAGDERKTHSGREAASLSPSPDDPGCDPTTRQRRLEVVPSHVFRVRPCNHPRPLRHHARR